MTAAARIGDDDGNETQIRRVPSRRLDANLERQAHDGNHTEDRTGPDASRTACTQHLKQHEQHQQHQHIERQAVHDVLEHVRRVKL